MKKYRRTLPILSMLLLLSGCGATKITMETQPPIAEITMELPPTEVQRMPEETSPVWEIAMENENASAEESTVPMGIQASIEESCPPQQAPQETEQLATEQTESPMTEPPLTEPPTTEQTEPILPTPPEQTTPPATEAPTEPEQTEVEAAVITYEYKRQVASFVAQYLNSYRSSPCTVLSGMSQVAQYRASQLTWNFAHSTADKRAALAYYGYGRWVDATLAGLEESDSYYESDTAEAICRNFHGNTPVELGRAIADLIRGSSSHWSYVGNSEYSYMGIGVEYQDGWYACVMVGTVNYG